MPASRGKNKVDSASDWIPPDTLLGAMYSLYRSYEREFEHWKAVPEDRRGTPPVFIVVCNNMAVSKLVYELIGGYEVFDNQRSSLGWEPGRFPLFSNVQNGAPKSRPTTILVDSAQMESGEQLSKDFKVAAAREIEAFKEDLRRRNPGRADLEITDEDLLREVMNTVGKPNMLGEQVRCVVSVSMLTEGWDANTVTHILGLRAFGSQLLCEQVVGRGLRRRSYDINEDGRFNPEYANVYGVPFQFIPSDKPVPPIEPPKPATRVCSVLGRDQYRITYPRVTGYRWEQPDDDLLYLPDDLEEFRIGPQAFPGWTETAGLVGVAERDELPHQTQTRDQAVAFSLTKELLNRHFKNDSADVRPWLFPRLLKLTKEWIHRAVVVEPGWSLSMLGEGTPENPRRFDQTRAKAAQELYNAVHRTETARRWVRPILAQFAPTGSTGEVDFRTSRQTIQTEKSEVSHVVLSSGGGDTGGNTWEQILTLEAERHPRVAAYVKNENLGFEIPYVLDGLSYHFEPDFILRLKPTVSDDTQRILIVETSGSLKREKEHRKTDQKAADARKWVAAVNNHGGFGRWGFIEIADILHAQSILNEAIDRLYADQPTDSITGDPDARLF
jgi:type III restriction enzyme